MIPSQFLKYREIKIGSHNDQIALYNCKKQGYILWKFNTK